MRMSWRLTRFHGHQHRHGERGATSAGNPGRPLVIAASDAVSAPAWPDRRGRRRPRNGKPSDNGVLAVGPDHIVQIVNGGMAVFTKKGRLFDTTGKVLYGPMRSNAIFNGFGGPCETRNSGDAVVRYDQLAQRWLYVLPVFQRGSTPPIAVTQLGVNPANFSSRVRRPPPA